MTRHRMIGLVGRAQHGKDTVGARLVERHGYTRFAFADPLKSMALALDPWIPSASPMMGDMRLSLAVELNGWEGAKAIPEVRRFLQVLGTEAVRGHLGDDSWVEATGKAIVDAGLPDAVITDVRFPNEARYIRQNGGVLVRVVRPNFDNGVPEDHPSEKNVGLISVDRTIVNDGTIRELMDQVDGLAADIREGFLDRLAIREDNELAGWDKPGREVVDRAGAASSAVRRDRVGGHIVEGGSADGINWADFPPERY